MPAMTTVIVSTGSYAMGTNYRVLGLARSARELGLDVHILLPGLRENHKWFPEGHYGGVPIHFMRCGAFAEACDKYEILCALRPQFVHCVDVVLRCFPVCLAYRMTQPCELIVDIDEHLSRIKLFALWKRIYFRVCENIVKRYADRLVVASRFLEQWFGRPKSRPILYLPNGVDLELFRKQQCGWEQLKLEWGGRKVVTYFGALTSHYDADLVFDAAVKILNRRQDLVFVFVGGGEMLDSFRERNRQTGLGNAIQFRGFVPDELVPRYLCAADVLVFPIRDNWWNRARCPGKVYQFAATKAPIVTNPVGEVLEALCDRAWYFRDGDGDDLIRVLEECLEARPGSRSPSEALARRHDWRARARSYCEFLSNGHAERSRETACEDDRRVASPGVSSR